jgi:hypothetical protein
MTSVLGDRSLAGLPMFIRHAVWSAEKPGCTSMKVKGIPAIALPYAFIRCEGAESCHLEVSNGLDVGSAQHFAGSLVEQLGAADLFETRQ